MSAATRWLVVSYFANIDGMAPSQHLDDRLPHLRARGIEPLLLTGPCCDPLPGTVHARVSSVAPSGLRFELRHRKKRAADALTRALCAAGAVALLPPYLVEKAVADLDSQWSWYPLAARRGIALCREQGPSLIWSTGGPWSAHVAAARIARETGLPWIAEMQDPLVHGDWLRSGTALRVSESVEAMIFREASAALFLTRAARDAAEARTGVRGKAVAIHSGAEPFADPPPAVERGPHFRFAHFGSLGGSRNLAVFLEALTILLRETPALADTVRLEVYGTVDRLSRARVEAFPWPGVVTLKGRVPRAESLHAMRRVDALLLIQNTEEFSIETIPSKSYEYLLAGPPVLGLVHRNPELASILETQGHVAAPADDPGAVKEAIAAMLREGGNRATRTCHASPWTVDAAVESLVRLARPLERRA
jgi:hypothetical protein